MCSNSNASMNSTCQFFVKEPSAGKTLVFHLPHTTTLKDLLEKITDKTGWPSKYFYITQNARPINMYKEEFLNMTLQELEINEENTIICHARISSSST